MTWGFSAQRRAEQFDAMLEGDAPVDARDADLLELVGAMRTVAPVAARPEFVADLRERLMAEAATALVPSDVSRLTLPDRRPARERRLAALVGGIAIVGATTSVAVASQSALPGDSLYPVKRAIERVHTGLSVGDGSKGSIVLASAADRLAEADALTRQDDKSALDDAQIAHTLDTFTDQSVEAADLLLSDYQSSGDASSIAELRDFTAASLDQLAALEPLVPPEARDELIRAAGVISAIDSKAAQRCPDCGGRGISSIPPVLFTSQPLPVPVQPTPSVGDASDAGAHHSKGHHQGDDTGLPEVDPNEIGPGSVSNPSNPALPGPTSGPLSNLVKDLTGGSTNTSDQPSIPTVSELLDGVGGILEGVLDPLTGEPVSKK